MGKTGYRAAAAVLAAALIATSAQAMTFEVSKQLEGLKFSKLTHLPRLPASGKGKSDCGGTLVDPRTEAGKLVAADGWGVTGEGALGDYTAVSFAASFIWGSSGVCTVEGGRVGIFQGKSPVAMLDQDTPSGEDIGSIIPLEGGSVRLLTGEATPYPQGDLRAVYDGFTLGDVAEADQVCGGKATVPNVYGFSIDQARLAVLRDGWQPLLLGSTTDGPVPGNREHDLVKAGVPEVQACGGTGLANCEFEYTSPAGKLSLDSIGEEKFPQVMSYAVQCTK